MAKYSRTSKLNKSLTEDLIINLCDAIAAMRNPREAAQFLTDLLGKQELEMFSKRLRVAELLLDNLTYEDIKTELKVSFGTIARVQTWLQRSGEGYRLATKRTGGRKKKKRQNSQSFSLSGIKKKYPLYFWPQILLEQWVKSATKKQRKEMSAILEKMDSKVETYKELRKLLSLEFKQPTTTKY